MEAKVEAAQPQFGSEKLGFGFDEISTPPETGSSSFTALLELPPLQAVELLVKEDFPGKHIPPPPPIFPSNAALIDRASKFSVFASPDNSLDKTAVLPASTSIKQEPPDSDSRLNSSFNFRKRKENEKKVKESNKKSKKVTANVASDESGEKLPYVHVRARRGQATDSHSLAERARREKINARMKLLKELVPGCNKISGTAMVLDEIINHVQALQCQVEFLSMRFAAAVNPRIDFNLDAVLAAESGSSIDNSYLGMFAPSIWAETQIDGTGQHDQCQQPLDFDDLQQQPSWPKEEGTSSFITTPNSFISYDNSPADSS